MLASGVVVLGRYVLESLLGRGAMGEVWKAKDTQLGCFVALKWMLPVAEGPSEEWLLSGLPKATPVP